MPELARRTRLLCSLRLLDVVRSKLGETPSEGSPLMPRTGPESPKRIRQRGPFAWSAGALLAVALCFVWGGSAAQAGPAWLPMAIPSGLTVTSAGFVSADEGWVTASSDTAGEDKYRYSILRTRDGGAHWETVYGPDPDLGFGPVCFSDELAGWVVAMRSRREPPDNLLVFDYYVLRTTDGGATWTKTPVALGTGLLYLNDIVFAEPSTGVIVGSGRNGIGAVIFRTIDGGATWAPYDAEAAGWGGEGITGGELHRRAERLGRRQLVLGFGEGVAIVHTGDGGLSWERQYGYDTETPTGDHPWYRDVDFVDAQHGWVVGDGGLLLRTIDGGETWQELAAPARVDLRAVDFLDPLEGWVAGSGRIRASHHGRRRHVGAGARRHDRFPQRSRGLRSGARRRLRLRRHRRGDPSHLRRRAGLHRHRLLSVPRGHRGALRRGHRGAATRSRAASSSGPRTRCGGPSSPR